MRCPGHAIHYIGFGYDEYVERVARTCARYCRLIQLKDTLAVLRLVKSYRLLSREVVPPYRQ